MSEVKTFKMMSGEEIIARIENETDERLTIIKPRTIAITPVGPGQAQLSLIPYVASDPDGEFDIPKTAIMCIIDLSNPELEKGYLEQTSGIVLS